MTWVTDLSEYGEGFRHDPYPVYARLRERGPVHRVRLGGADGPYETWLVVGYEEARAALTDPRLVKGSERIGATFLDEQLIGRHLLISDPPQHTRLRALVSRAFTMRRVEELRPRVQGIVDDLLDAMLPPGRADLVESFAFPLPLTVICELLGVPEIDRTAFREMSTEVVAPTDADHSYDAFVRLGAYLTELIEDKRSAGSGGDLLSDLIRTTAEDGDRLSPEELRGMAFLLLVAGHETTVNLITNTVHALLTHPEQLAALRADPNLLDGVIEETLRWEGPVENATYRFAVEPVEIGGVTLEKGDPSPGRPRLRRPPPRSASLARGHPHRSPLPEPRPLRHTPRPARPPRLRPRHPLLPGRPAGPPGGAHGATVAARPRTRPRPGRPARRVAARHAHARAPRPAGALVVRPL